VTKNDSEWLAERFETARPNLRAVAYRMLGSEADADDAVQEAWLRLQRTDADEVENLNGWLTMAVARLCLDRLRSRRGRREDPAEVEPEASAMAIPDELGPEHEALLAEAVGSALLIVLDQLGPAQRVAFVLHDIFAVPFDEIGPIVDRSPEATRKLASRARRRVQGVPETAAGNREHQRAILEAFVAASREGNFEALLAVLDPDVTFRADAAGLRLGAPHDANGRDDVVRSALGRAYGAKPGLIDGEVGLVAPSTGRPRVAFCVTYTRGRIAAINMIADPGHLNDLDIRPLETATDSGTGSFPQGA
jgi:RNA polymerase sigma factor (sigma-70 family)